MQKKDNCEQTAFFVRHKDKETEEVNERKRVRERER